MNEEQSLADEAAGQSTTDGSGMLTNRGADERRALLALVGVTGAAFVGSCAPEDPDAFGSAKPHSDGAGVHPNLAALTSTSIMWADTVAELFTLTGASAQALIVSGYHAPGDGGGGIFSWNSASTATHDGGLVFQPTGLSVGRWQRIAGRPVNIRWFGVRDTATPSAADAADNSLRLKRAIDAVGVHGGAVHVPAGTYVLGSSVHLQRTAARTYNQVVLEGDGQTSMIRSYQALSAPMIWFDGLGTPIQDVGIRQIRFQGADEITAAAALVQFSGCKGSYAIDCVFERSAGAGAAWTTSGPMNENIRLAGNYATRIGGFGSSSGSGSFAFYVVGHEVAVIGNRTFETGGALYYGGNSAIIADNIIEFCKVGGNYTAALNLLPGIEGRRTLIQGNTIRAAHTGVVCSSSTGELLVTTNIFESCTQAVSVSGIDGPLVIRGNHIYDALTANSAAITYGTTSESTYAIIDQNTIVRGPTSPWGYAIRVASAGAKTLVRKNVVVGAAATGPLFLSHDENIVTEFLDNTVRGEGALTDVSPRYRWRGQSYSKAQFIGVDEGVVLSTYRPSELRLGSPPAPGTIPPVLASGAQVWGVGDVIANASPSEEGTAGSKFIVQGWTCVAGGAPASWREIRNATGN